MRQQDKITDNFKWDVFLDRVSKKRIELKPPKNYIAPLTPGYEEQRNIELDALNAKSFIVERTMGPIFEIDEDMIVVLQGIGYNYIQHKAEEQVLKFIKLPYPNMTIQYARCNNKLRQFVCMNITGPMELDLTSEFESDHNENINFQHALVEYEGKEKKPMVVFDRIVKGIYLDKFSDQKIEEANLFEMNGWPGGLPVCFLIEVIIGLCIALNTRQLYTEENIAPRKSNYHYERKEEIVREHGYKKLGLSLKGKQHLEYIQANRFGSKSKSRMHLRRGHFKQRKTGLFWWNPHIAGKESEYVIEKSYIIKE